jgi:hypothetical protein
LIITSVEQKIKQTIPETRIPAQYPDLNRKIVWSVK